ncbi:Rne/Rng family ribonuclease [Aquisediminimonas profunda]|uniref:Rne/Rng family ribonuclease n=1 Tax=Aquisediminimonas profunda TaxID=1550733 RepID=UPI001C638EE5|nr:ribonuclease E/G [Aquisediminimonas profunda]
MTMRMLIDARHREETRVAVAKGNRIEEFDFESAEHKQLKGNIYLAKVTRVEPSLQAAFVDYGGNRHGFLAFSEIHPDYYQIPKEDREALLREEAEHAEEEERLREAEGDDEPIDGHHEDDGRDNDRPDADVEPDDSDEDEDGDVPRAETVGGGDTEDSNGRDGNAAASALRAKRMALRRRYKIQDVIHRRQVLLVQVVKEERGNKGAALTTYLSLAGRYCVLMPNTTHGGGISRKISNAADRKRLKTIMAELELPRTMGCIVRTAGLQRTKVEIRRDFDYLARVWDTIRETTLKSSAPALIHNDSDLIKRAIRDIYNKDIDEVIVEGEEGYRAAREYMKLLMPSHAKRVQPYSDVVPLFQRYHVEDQLNAMYQPIVQLKSGGYLVINPTEALVSIDINSGRSTREHGIEATAVGTNLEAAQEIARQLRLRDMAGLVVIDFIDMEHNSNVRKVEKAMKAALANDRARIQVGRISSFGLMEMSRQRLRTGVLEASTRQCPHCEGTGLVRTASSAALSALRLLEEEAAKGNGSRLSLRASQEATIYVLNRKRAELAEIEERYGVSIDIFPDGETEGARMVVEASGPPPAYRPKIEPLLIEDDDDLDIEADVEDEDEDAGETESQSREGRDSEGRRKRSRRRRGRRGRREEGDERPASEEGEAEAPRETSDAEGEEEGGHRRGRRGRRGGRGRRGDRPEAANAVASDDAAESAPVEAPSDVTEAAAEAAPKKTRRRPSKARPDAEAVAAEPVAIVEAPAAAEAPAEKPKRSRKKAEPKADKAAAEVAPVEAAPAAPSAEAPAEKPKRVRKPKAEPAQAAQAAPVAAQTAEATDGSPRRGWWQRTFGPES